MGSKIILKPQLKHFIRNHKYVFKGLFLFFMILSILVVDCEDRYNKGYANGFKESEAKGYDKGMRDGEVNVYEKVVQKEYDKDYSDAIYEKINRLKTIGEVFSASRSTTNVFWIFSILNMLALFGVSLYLVARVKILSVQIGKILIYVVSTYIWFRINQSVLLANNIPGAKSTKLVQLFIEGFVALIAFLFCLAFDHFYIKTESRRVWGDCIGIAFCTFLFLQFLHYLINWKQLLSVRIPTYSLHIVGAFSIGGIFYIIYALLSRFVKAENDESKNSNMSSSNRQK